MKPSKHQEDILPHKGNSGIVIFLARVLKQIVDKIDQITSLNYSILEFLESLYIFP